MWAAVAAAAGQSTDPAAGRAASHVGGVRLLDVPYLPQTEDLCGGAALAMTLRYWGDREVYPEDFAALVDRGAAGIRTDVLAAEAHRRGWQSFPVAAVASSSGAWIQQHVDRGRPVIALVEVRPNRYHYLVIVGWTGEQVVAHDPARAPFRVMSRAEFDRAWAAAGRWALLVLPQEGRPSPPRTSPEREPDGATRDTDACGMLVQEMVTLARAGNRAGADAGLLTAIALCPGHPAALRELAGVRFLQSRWGEASALAERAALLDPGDEQGWNLLATSRFLDDRPEAALEAWNFIGRPSVDLVRVEGLERTRHSVIATLVDLPPRTLLTAENLGRAARRLDELPSAAITRLRYRPVEGGLAEVEAVVVERHTVPRGVVPVVAVAAHTWLGRELSLDVAAPTGSGELWTVAWRWWEARPRFGVAVAVPAAAPWLPGVTTIEGWWEQSSYAAPDPAGTGSVAIQSEDRRRAAVSVADWATSRVRWQAGAALDRWAAGRHLSVDAAVDLRFAADRLSLGIDAAAWVPLGSGAQFTTVGITSAWRSAHERDGPAWALVAGLAAASAAAPFDLWPGAGTGQARLPLLRAHPLLDDGIVTGPAFGRTLAHATIEYQRPILAARWGAFRLAAFADTATAWSRVGHDGGSASHADIGAGVRVVLAGNGGTFRADVARGLRDGRVVVSSGWQAPWPGR